MQKYKKVRTIGKGSFGYAVLVRNVEELDSLSVMKIIDIEKMTQKQREESLTEIKCLRSLDHPFIIKYKESFIEKKALCIVMDYADGGDLYGLINGYKERKQLMEESLVVRIFAQVCMALQAVHNKKILHRDLKTQNVFLTAQMQVKLGDFGIARILQHTYDLAKTAIGTPYFLSPEICQDLPYNSKSDVWSLGCILYEMLSLSHAFDAFSMRGLVLKIIQGTFAPPPNSYSQNIQSLLKALLQTDPEARPTVEQVLGHPALAEEVRRLKEQFGMTASKVVKIKDKEQSKSQILESSKILKSTLGDKGSGLSPLPSKPTQVVQTTRNAATPNKDSKIAKFPPAPLEMPKKEKQIESERSPKNQYFVLPSGPSVQLDHRKSPKANINKPPVHSANALPMSHSLVQENPPVKRSEKELYSSEANRSAIAPRRDQEATASQVRKSPTPDLNSRNQMTRRKTEISLRVPEPKDEPERVIPKPIASSTSKPGSGRDHDKSTNQTDKQGNFNTQPDRSRDPNKSQKLVPKLTRENVFNTPLAQKSEEPSQEVISKAAKSKTVKTQFEDNKQAAISKMVAQNADLTPLKQASERSKLKDNKSNQDLTITAPTVAKSTKNNEPGALVPLPIPPVSSLPEKAKSDVQTVTELNSSKKTLVAPTFPKNPMDSPTRISEIKHLTPVNEFTSNPAKKSLKTSQNFSALLPVNPDDNSANFNSKNLSKISTVENNESSKVFSVFPTPPKESRNNPFWSNDVKIDKSPEPVREIFSKSRDVACPGSSLPSFPNSCQLPEPQTPTGQSSSKSLADPPLKSAFLFTSDMPIVVDKNDSAAYKAEALKIYLEKELGLDSLLEVYNAVKEGSGEKHYSEKEERHLPFIHQLIFLEDRAFGN